MKTVRTVALATAASLGLAGCAGIPVVISAASLYVDTVLVLRTEKSATDHVISAVAERDCGLLNVVRNGRLCEDAPPPQLLVAVTREVQAVAPDAATGAEGPDPRRIGRPAPAPVQVADAPGAALSLTDDAPATATAPDAPPAAPAAVPPAVRTAGTRTEVAVLPAAKPAPPAEPPGSLARATVESGTGRLLVVVGSFPRRDLAETHRRRLGDDAAGIVEATVDGRPRYRVVIRPADRTDALRRLRLARADGIADAWLLPWSGNLSVDSAVAALPYVGWLYRI
ncbi:SPOR domain-containing protein [Azospirillum halopraeferens]|uniref:SPOR domain-containing protein n=1 Tax=Azospirillum halopraeferens TaxID=34010 RepID=UPI000426A1CF|nr:SPOR domain-containing protein [Azospirillum halopraeferens]